MVKRKAFIDSDSSENSESDLDSVGGPINLTSRKPEFWEKRLQAHLAGLQKICHWGDLRDVKLTKFSRGFSI